MVASIVVVIAQGGIVVVIAQGGSVAHRGLVVPATKPSGVSTHAIVVGPGVVSGGGVVNGGGAVGGGVIFANGGGPSVGSILSDIVGRPGKPGRGLLRGAGSGGGGPGRGGGGGGASIGGCAGAGIVVVTPSGKPKPVGSGAAPGSLQPHGQAPPVNSCLLCQELKRRSSKSLWLPARNRLAKKSAAPEGWNEKNTNHHPTT